MTVSVDIELTKAYIVGGGIAGLATAAYLIRDGRLAGTNISIFEEGTQTGGSLDAHPPELLKTANCIPCMMPYITSQFLVRAEGDRPAVVPKGARNFAFLGQYCEIADDVVFTVEYSVRSAQIAVFALLDLDKKVSQIYKGQHDPSVLFNSVKAMLK